MTREYVAYKGEKFTIEWYYDASNQSESLSYADSLDNEYKGKFAALLRLMGDRGEISNLTKFRNEGDQIYAFKIKPYRFLCFFQIGRKIIITNGFHKKQDKLPINEKKKALKYKSDYELRIKKGEASSQV